MGLAHLSQSGDRRNRFCGTETVRLTLIFYNTKFQLLTKCLVYYIYARARCKSGCDWLPDVILAGCDWLQGMPPVATYQNTTMPVSVPMHNSTYAELHAQQQAAQQHAAVAQQQQQAAAAAQQRQQQQQQQQAQNSAIPTSSGLIPPQPGGGCLSPRPSSTGQCLSPRPRSQGKHASLTNTS